MSKMISIVILALLTTTALFALMTWLIDQEIAATISEPLVVVTVYQTPEDSDVVTKQPATIEPPKMPELMPKTAVEESEGPGEISIGTEFSEIKLETGSGGPAVIKAPNQEAQPIVRIAPKYPISAATKGIQGWVKLSFDITPLGGVTNIKVLESSPKRVFEQSAKQALKRWKYKAKLVDGKAIVQRNQTVQLDFAMEQQG